MEERLDKNNNSFLKISSFYFSILFESEKVNYIINKNKPFDPLLNFSKDIEEIKNILKSNPKDILYFLYFNMDNIEKILYNEDKIIYFDVDEQNNYFLKINEEKIEIEKKNEIVILFYISLLIKYNKNIVNFSLSFDLINNINSLNKNKIDVNNLYKNVLISKMILELINFYKSYQIFEEKNKENIIEKIKEVENSNNEIIEKCFDDFEKLELNLTENELKLKNIDLIFAKIINILLKSKDYNLIEQLDLENINITKAMFNEIFETFSAKESFINEYKLITFDDLFDSEKIDFYYILFKYILKNSIYIYYIDFLNKTRKTIISIIHLIQNKKINLSCNESKKLDNQYKNKLIYIIKFLTNTDYYVEYINLNNKLSDDNINPKIKLNKDSEPILNKKNEEDRSDSNDTYNKLINNDSSSNNKFYGDGEQQQNNLSTTYTNVKEFTIKSGVKEEFLDKVDNILKESTINLIINKEKKIEYKDIIHQKGKITYEELINPFKDFSREKFDINKDIDYNNYIKLIGFLDKIKDIIIKISISEVILEKELSIKINLQRDFNQTNDDYINSEYSLENPIFKNDEKYKDKDILNNGNYEGFIFFSKKIINNPQILFFGKNPSISVYGTSTNNNVKELLNEIKEHNKYKIIKFKKIIGKHQKFAEKIKEFDNGSFISDGKEFDNGSFISDGYNEIFTYNTDYNLIKKYDLKNYYSFFIDENDAIISQKNKLTFLNSINDDIKAENTCRNLFIFKGKAKNFIICYDNNIYFSSYNLKDLSNNKKFLIYEKAYRGGIKIDDNFLAITSNEILSKGENKLIFFGLNSKVFLKKKEVENYSFILSESNCSLMKIPKQENSCLLLVACKKYIKNDKNGILLLKLQFDKNELEKYEKFYDTKNFEVYCFCPILKIEVTTVLENSNKGQINETEYFFVGGFDQDKNEGLIKLYKVIYDDEIKNIEIKYIQDIIIEKKIGKEDSKCFKGFKGPISCIIQSSMGEILVTSYDGNVYSFSKPNIDLLNQDYNILK